MIDRFHSMIERIRIISRRHFQRSLSMTLMIILLTRSALKRFRCLLMFEQSEFFCITRDDR